MFFFGNKLEQFLGAIFAVLGAILDPWMAEILSLKSYENPRPVILCRISADFRCFSGSIS